MSSAPSVTRSDFDTQVLQSDQPVLVDFWAAWCPPCRALAPVLDAVAQDYQGKAKIVKIDIDAEPEIADRYGIRSIPTLMLFKHGTKVSELVGAHPKETLSRLLDSAL